MTTEERLQRLEAAVSQLGAGNGAVQKVARAERFELVDKNGKARAQLGVTEDGPSLALTDEEGKPRVIVTVTEDRPTIVLTDENGVRRVELEVMTKVGPSLCLYDERNVLRTQMYDGILRLQDERGKIRVALRVDEDGPLLVLRDVQGKNRAILTVREEGPTLTLWDERGELRSGLTEDALRVSNEQGKERWITP